MGSTPWSAAQFQSPSSTLVTYCRAPWNGELGQDRLVNSARYCHMRMSHLLSPEDAPSLLSVYCDWKNGQKTIFKMKHTTIL